MSVVKSISPSIGEILFEIAISVTAIVALLLENSALIFLLIALIFTFTIYYIKKRKLIFHRLESFSHIADGNKIKAKAILISHLGMHSDSVFLKVLKTINVVLVLAANSMFIFYCLMGLAVVHTHFK